MGASYVPVPFADFEMHWIREKAHSQVYGGAKLQPFDNPTRDLCWLATIAAVRAECREECAVLAEAYLHAESNDSSAPDRLDQIARYSNGTVKRIAAAIRSANGTHR